MKTALTRLTVLFLLLCTALFAQQKGTFTVTHLAFSNFTFENSALNSFCEEGASLNFKGLFSVLQA